MLGLTVRSACEQDYDVILSLTNEAFMADTFFKREEYYLRFDLQTVQDMVRSENSLFLIASQSLGDTVTDCGSIFLHWVIFTVENEIRVSEGNVVFRKTACAQL